jgi:allantoinase
VAIAEFDVILRGGSVVDEHNTVILDIAVSEGRIAAVEPAIEGIATETIDLTGYLVFPGAIDPHVHFNEPGRTDWEGWASGSRALVAGGTTCAIEMPLNAHPPTLDRESFLQKQRGAEASSLVDFALWGGLTPTNVDRLEELAEVGAVGFKAFMSRSGTDDFQAADDYTLYKGMQTAAALGLPVAVHAESDAITAGLATEAIAQGRLSLRDYAQSRPIVAELEAIGRACQIAHETGCALHIVHVSSGRGVALIAEARAAGTDVSCETCPHYLVFTEDDLAELGNLLKCAPPLRDAATVESLWAALRGGAIDMISSDHSPAPPELKMGDNAFAVWGGISGCQHLRPAMLTYGPKRHLEANDIVRLTSSAVAARFRLPDKGRIAVGHGADIVWGAMQPDREVAASEVAYRHPASAWDGVAFNYRHLGTMVRGNLVYRGGTWLDSHRGRLIRPSKT